MAIKYLKADALPALLEALAKNARVVAPFKTGRRGAVRALAVRQGRRARRAAGQAEPKEYVFLQTETYLKFGYEMAPIAGGRRRRSGHPARDGGGRRR